MSGHWCKATEKFLIRVNKVIQNTEFSFMHSGRKFMNEWRSVKKFVLSIRIGIVKAIGIGIVLESYIHSENV